MYGGRGERGKEGTSGGPDEIVFKWSGARNDDRSGDDDDDGQGCQMAKFDPFLSLDCARVEVVGRNLHPGTIQGKEGIKFCSVA